MKKTLVVVEGQTESIFVEKFLSVLVATVPYRVELHKLITGGRVVHVQTQGDLDSVSIHLIVILDAGADEHVNSFIFDRAVEFKKRGFDRVYGLRDLYTGDKNVRRIDQEKIDKVFAQLSGELGMDINLTVAVNEVEAWFLAVPTFFSSCDPELTVDKVAEILKLNFSDIRVEDIEHPAACINKVLATRGMQYKKRKDQVNRIVHNLDFSSLYLEKRQEIAAFDRFTSNLESAVP